MDAIRQMAAVAAVLGLMGLTLWWLRRRGLAVPLPAGRRGGRRLATVERLPLGPQHALHLVRVGGRGLLLASHPSGCVLLETLPWREFEAPREAAP